MTYAELYAADGDLRNAAGATEERAAKQGKREKERKKGTIK